MNDGNNNCNDKNIGNDKANIVLIITVTMLTSLAITPLYLEPRGYMGALRQLDDMTLLESRRER